MSVNQNKNLSLNEKLKIMNNKKATLEDAIAIAAQAHKGVTDKAGAVYILHPLRIMMQMKTESEMMTAILHDVVEDSAWTIEKLREQGFSEEVLEAIECVTNREGESYEEFIERAGTNPIARQVKIADLEDNMDVKRLKTLTDKDTARLAKYLRSWILLNSKDKNFDPNNSAQTPVSTVGQKKLYTGKPLTKLTPELAAESKALMDKTSKAVIDGLHRENQEVFGEDYLNQKS